MKASEILSRAVILLNDKKHVRWPLTELCDWLNEGIRAIVLAKPSASTKTLTLNLVEGTKQEVPQTGTPQPLMLISINRNMVAGKPGRAVTIIDQALLDEENPNWHDKADLPFRPQVRHYVYSEADPLTFYVYPGNTGTGVVEATVSTCPDAIAGSGTKTELTDFDITVPLPEPYSVPLLDYVMYRAFLKDDIAGQGSKGAGHFQQFMAAVGLKIQVEGATSPNTKRPA